MQDFAAVAWVEDKPGNQGGRRGRLRLLDQTRLPTCEAYLELNEAAAIFSAIQRLVVRGAPALGCAAALGLAAVSGESRAREAGEFMREVEAMVDYLASSRPTAVNLSWALQRCLQALRQAVAKGEHRVAGLQHCLVEEGLAVLAEDQRLCHSIGRHGCTLFAGRAGLSVLTHCNAGALATGGRGTALAPIYEASRQGLAPRVLADETRPLLQGSRLTAWELQRAGVEVTVICDNMAAQVMREGRVDLIIVGADRIAANGDTANKIGTYAVAILAAYHRIPFYVAAPYSTIDMQLSEGGGIPIEIRPGNEVVDGFGRRTGPENCAVYNPAFDLTPASLITGIITERGILKPPLESSISRLFGTEPRSSGLS